MPDYSHVFIEIGGRDNLTRQVIEEVRTAPLLAARAQPGRPIVLMVGGYDDDPRELWDIPEAAAHIRAYAVSSGLADWRSPLFRCLAEEAIGLLVACRALYEPHPYRANMGTTRADDLRTLERFHR